MMGLNQREIPAALGQVSSSQNIENRLHRKSPEEYSIINHVLEGGRSPPWVGPLVRVFTEPTF
jgi:hypothetical protein